MRNLKRVLALALALVMILGMMVIGSSAASYSDAAAIDAKYNEAVEVLSGMGVFQGNGAGFAPKAILSRAEASALIYRVLTGDVTDAQKVNYNYSSFDDVAAGEWYTGYVTYAANGGYIKGDGTGNFNPYDTVTGVQVMAIMLRAIGYGQNGEYEGAAWMDNILTDAKELGITGNIATSTLVAPASREVVAQLIFNAINNVEMVTYAPALGYIAADFTSNNWRGSMTLGQKIFGLDYAYGVVVGNQATNEQATKITFAVDGVYSYDYAKAYDFATATDLDLFGHAVKVWYNNYTLGQYSTAVTYALFDKATKTATTTNRTYWDAKQAGFYVTYDQKYKNDVVGNLSDAYNQFDTSFETTYPYYVMISNNALGLVDVVIGLDAKVAKIVAHDTTDYDPKLTMENYGEIWMEDISAGSTTTLGATVIANKVKGTNVEGYAKYNLEAVTATKIGTVVEIDAATGKLILADGTVVEKSPLYNYVVSGVAQVATWKNVKYVITLDNNGKYLGAREYNDNTFIYGTFADYASAGTNTGTVNYYLTGVTLDGQIVTSNITKYLGLNPMANYMSLDVAQKAWSNNNIEVGEHTGYAITSTGSLTTDASVAGVKNLGNEWAITAGNVKAGFVANTAATQFMTSATKFIVVAGTGTDSLKVTTFNGIGELLGSADEVEFVGDNMYYVDSAYIYNHVVGETTHINTVILSADDLKYTTTSNLYYVDSVEKGLASTAKVGDAVIEVFQYKMYKDGDSTFVYLKDEPIKGKFYTLTLVGKTVSGADLYAATSTEAGTESGKYAYIGATNNLDTAVIDGVLYNVSNAKVVNLRAKYGIAGSIAELNNAVSTGYTVVVDCVKGVGNSIALIYVTYLGK